MSFFVKYALPVIFVSSISLTAGCGLFKAGTAENTTAKTVVSTMVAAVSVLDAVCAQTAIDIHDAQLAQDCADAYTRTRDKLVAVQTALENNDQSFVCAVKVCESALEDFADIYKARSGKELPQAVIVAESIGRAFGAQCR